MKKNSAKINAEEDQSSCNKITLKNSDSNELEKIAKKLYDIGILSISVLLKEKNGKKVMVKKPKSFDNLNKTNCLKSIKNCHNCLTILTGSRSSIVVLDIDDKTKDGIGNGMTFWNNLIKEYGEIKTWKVITGNNGYHYYFKYDNHTKKLKTKSNVVINGAKYSIDIRNEKGLIYAPPTFYETDDGIKLYQWIRSPFDTELQDMPNWLFDFLSDDNNLIINKEITNKSNRLLLYLILESAISGASLSQNYAIDQIRNRIFPN